MRRGGQNFESEGSGAKYLSWSGKKRKAIVDGLKQSVTEFDQNVKGTSTKDIMDMLLLTQYFDAIKEVGSADNCKTTFIPSGSSLGDQMRNGILQADASTS